MRTAILNMKGGVAKTTTVINMASILAETGYKVLVVDADNQCNTTEFLGGGSCATFAAMLRGSDAETCRTNIDGVFLIPADESLMDLDLSKAEDGRADILSLKKALDGPCSGYDFVLVDCPPAFTAATAAALLAANNVIIPMKLDAFSVRGMTNLYRQIDNMRQLNPNLTISGILPTMWYRSEAQKNALMILQDYGLPIYHPIRRSPTIDKMTYCQTPLQICSKNSGALRDYRAFVEQYLRKEGQGDGI